MEYSNRRDWILASCNMERKLQIGPGICKSFENINACANLPIGLCAPELENWCRNGKEAKKCYKAFTTEYFRNADKKVRVSRIYNEKYQIRGATVAYSRQDPKRAQCW
ncbi:hypothetical protein WA026_018346 [Henosepilachna vigintioctopunctata]|uniref:Uncharacterized protein n=1 Tax=Henosepilachna vigintioctopunctata TaxID=420089 RepID=A0AAW1VGF9_9CUCU